MAVPLHKPYLVVTWIAGITINTHDIEVVDTVGTVDVTIGSGQSTIDIHDTSQHIFIDARGLGNDTINLLGIGGNIDVKSWYDDDSVTVDMLAGSLVIDAGEGNDIVTVDYLGGKSSAIITLDMKSSSSLMILLAQLGNGTVPGGPGNDRLLLDGETLLGRGTPTLCTTVT